MSLATVTAKTLSESLEIEIPEIYVVIAKHRVLGLDSTAVAEILGVDLKDVMEVESSEEYQLVRTHIGAIYASTQSEKIHGWDGLESVALQKLNERLRFEKDPEFLLKVAVMANKANRRGGSDMGVLDPAKASRTAVTITARLVQRMIEGNRMQEAETLAELSIKDGSMAQVNYEEVSGLLDAGTQAVRPARLTVDSYDVTDVDSMRKEMESLL